jgi:hypothetical protein
LRKEARKAKSGNILARMVPAHPLARARVSRGGWIQERVVTFNAGLRRRLTCSRYGQISLCKVDLLNTSESVILFRYLTEPRTVRQISFALGPTSVVGLFTCVSLRLAKSTIAFVGSSPVPWLGPCPAIEPF